MVRECPHCGHELGIPPIWVAPTQRQQQILQLLADGYTQKQIAEMFRLAENTVRNHITLLYDRLHAWNVSHAVAIGIRLGFIK